MNERDIENQRAPTGVHGLDVLLGGGLFEGSVTMPSGRPGAGTTILLNPIASALVARGGRVVYATLLAEGR